MIRARNEGTAAKAAKNATISTSTTHSTGIAASSARPKDKSPPATPVSCPPREAYTSSNTGSTLASKITITASIKSSITAGYKRALRRRRSIRLRSS